MARTRRLEIDDIEVELVRKRVRNINLRIRSDGSVSMSAPAWVSEAEIARFVETHSDWIREHQEKTRGRAKRRESFTWSSGDQVLLWGDPLTITLSTDPRRSRATVKRQGSLLAIAGPTGLASTDDEAKGARHDLVETFWKHELERALPPVIARSEETVGQHAAEWRVRRMKTRWGSCSIERRRIWLNAELASKPPECLDYVAIHELCHLIEPSHGKRFHALMDLYAPDWRDVKRILNERPPLA